jgi:hypothetical protein
MMMLHEVKEPPDLNVVLNKPSLCISGISYSPTYLPNILLRWCEMSGNHGIYLHTLDKGSLYKFVVC